MTSTPAIPVARSQQRHPRPTRPAAARPRTADTRTSLERAASDAARLADQLLDLHRDLTAVVATDPELRAAWYRLEDAARTCRRAAEEFGATDGFRPAG